MQAIRANAKSSACTTLCGHQSVDENTEYQYDLQTLVALAAEPMASLVDTFWVGRIGPAELAACAAAQTFFNLVTKLINVPLTAVTVSMIAQATAATAKDSEEGPASSQVAANDQQGDIAQHAQNQALPDAVTGATLLGCLVGTIQCATLPPPLSCPQSHKLPSVECTG